MPRGQRSIKSKRGGAEAEYVAKGDNGCVLKGDVPKNCEGSAQSLNVRVEPTDVLLTKVTPYAKVYEQEWGVAQTLFRIDPQQQYFLYPISVCKSQVALPDHLKAACNFDDSMPIKQLYLMQVKNGGTSLEDMARRGRTLTRTQAEKVIEDVREGLRVLHNNGLAHGDIHHGNVLVAFDQGTGQVHARIIDFGFLSASTPEKKLSDVKDFLERIILGTLSTITEGGSFKVPSASDETVFVKNPEFQRVDDIRAVFVPKGTGRYVSSQPGASVQETPVQKIRLSVPASSPVRARKLNFGDM